MALISAPVKRIRKPTRKPVAGRPMPMPRPMPGRSPVKPVRPPIMGRPAPTAKDALMVLRSGNTAKGKAILKQVSEGKPKRKPSL